MAGPVFRGGGKAELRRALDALRGGLDHAGYFAPGVTGASRLRELRYTLEGAEARLYRVQSRLDSLGADQPPNRTDFLVGSAEEWQAAEQAVQPGQVIRIRNGDYRQRPLGLLGAIASGTAERPIWVCAETPGSVVLGTGSQFGSFGNYRYWHGLVWQGARSVFQAEYETADGTRQAESWPGACLALNGTTGNRVQDCAFDTCAAVDSNDKVAHYVMLLGWTPAARDVTVRRVSFFRSQTCPVGFSAGREGPVNSTIEDCFFSETGYAFNQMTDIAPGTGQAGREYTGDASDVVSWARGHNTVIRRNLFHASGALGVISNKVSDTTFSDNIILDCPGQASTTQRVGGWCSYQRNYISNAGYGLNIHGPGHLVEDNIVVDPWRAGCLVLTLGNVEGTQKGGEIEVTNAYPPVIDCMFRRNTLVGREVYQTFPVMPLYVEGTLSQISWQGGDGATVYKVPSRPNTTPWYRSVQPDNNVFQDMILYSNLEGVFNTADPVDLFRGNRWENVVAWSEVATPSAPPSVRIADPGLEWRTVQVYAKTGHGPFELQVPYPSGTNAGADPAATLRAWL